jgi:hypothetical protein
VAVLTGVVAIVLAIVAGPSLARALRGHGSSAGDETTGRRTRRLAPVEAPSLPAAASPCAGTAVPAGADLQAAVAQAPEGATLCVGPGTFRLERALRPKPRQVLRALAGTTLDGSRPLTGFVAEGQRWFVDGQIPAEHTVHGSCARTSPPGQGAGDRAGKSGPGEGAVGKACRYANDLYLDGEPLRRVTDVGAVEASSATFFMDYDRNRIYIGRDPTGHTVEEAVATGATVGPADGVGVQGFRVARFATTAQEGAIDSRPGRGWAVADNEVLSSHGVGICTGGDSLVLRNNVHHNGQLGLCGDDGANLVVRGNDVAFNNTAGFSSDWEAGGGKWTRVDGLIVQANRFHDNTGPGIWTDIDTIRVQVLDNVVSDNTGSGIFHEISYQAEIARNRVAGNGVRGTNPDQIRLAGIAIAGSRDVRISDNVVAGNRNAITLVQDERESGRYGAHRLKAVVATHNTIILGDGSVGLVQNVHDDSYFSLTRVSFTDNAYRLGSNPHPFRWRDHAVTRAEWVAAGQDPQSVFTASASAT